MSFEFRVIAKQALTSEYFKIMQLSIKQINRLLNHITNLQLADRL